MKIVALLKSQDKLSPEGFIRPRVCKELIYVECFS